PAEQRQRAAQPFRKPGKQGHQSARNRDVSRTIGDVEQRSVDVEKQRQTLRIAIERRRGRGGGRAATRNGQDGANTAHLNATVSFSPYRNAGANRYRGTGNRSGVAVVIPAAQGQQQDRRQGVDQRQAVAEDVGDVDQRALQEEEAHGNDDAEEQPLAETA